MGKREDEAKKVALLKRLESLDKCREATARRERAKADASLPSDKEEYIIKYNELEPSPSSIDPDVGLTQMINDPEGRYKRSGREKTDSSSSASAPEKTVEAAKESSEDIEGEGVAGKIPSENGEANISSRKRKADNEDNESNTRKKVRLVEPQEAEEGEIVEQSPLHTTESKTTSATTEGEIHNENRAAKTILRPILKRKKNDDDDKAELKKRPEPRLIGDNPYRDERRTAAPRGQVRNTRAMLKEKTDRNTKLNQGSRLSPAAAKKKPKAALAKDTGAKTAHGKSKASSSTKVKQGKLVTEFTGQVPRTQGRKVTRGEEQTTSLEAERKSKPGISRIIKEKDKGETSQANRSKKRKADEDLEEHTRKIAKPNPTTNEDIPEVSTVRTEVGKNHEEHGPDGEVPKIVNEKVTNVDNTEEPQQHDEGQAESLKPVEDDQQIDDDLDYLFNDPDFEYGKDVEA